MTSTTRDTSEPTRRHHRKGAAVHLADITKIFRLGGGQELRAVDHVTLNIEPGTVVALTGPSGSGKSTLLHLIGAIERPESGSVRVDDVDLAGYSRRDLADFRRRLGFVFQRYNLLPALTALDNVTAPVLPYRTTFDKTDRARQLLAAVGLERRENSVPARLSGGQQQRVAIARALIGDPHLILADEPTGNLDSETGQDIIELLLSLNREQNITLVIATHDVTVASQADRLVRLLDGKIVGDEPIPDAIPTERLLPRIAGFDPG